MTLPVSVDSNITGLSIAEELTLKVLPGTPIWYGLEPNTYPSFGATFPSVAREPINATRQRLKGTITDETVKGGFNIDLTQRNLTRFLQGFFFADAIEKTATQPFNGTQTPFTSVSATQFVAAAGLGGFLINALVSAKGFGQLNNNGLAHITAVAAGSLTTDKALTVEASPPAAAQLETVGIRGAAGDLHIALSGASNVIVTSTALDFTTLGLSVGEWIYLGGDAAINRWVTAIDAAVGNADTNTGYARLSAIAAHTLTFDFTSFTPLLDADAGALQKVDIYFGKVISNAVLPTNVKRRSYQLERTLGNDGVGTQVEYLTGCIADEIILNVKQASKIDAALTFMGLNIENYSGAVGVKAGTRVGLLGESALNSSTDVFLSRLAIVDPTTLNPAPLYAFVQDITLTINNLAIATKAIGVLGGFNTTQGNFTVSGAMTAYFQSVAAIAAIKANANVALQLIIARNNAGMVFDIPLLQLGDGLANVTKDKAIMVALKQEAAKNPAGYTLMGCFFEYLPTVAMPD
jgi:hypothetical protein